MYKVYLLCMEEAEEAAGEGPRPFTNKIQTTGSVVAAVAPATPPGLEL